MITRRHGIGRFMAAAALMSCLVSGAAAWESHGPYAAHVTTLAATPDSSWIYATTDRRGVLRRSSAEARWVAAGFAGQSPTSIAVDRNDDRHLYLLHRFFLYESVDGGDSWRQTGDDSSGWLSGRSVSVDHAATLYVPTQCIGDQPGFSQDCGILTSTDGGRTWNHSYKQDSADYRIRATRGAVVGIFDNSLLRTTDRGRHWSRRTLPFYARAVTSAPDDTFIAVASDSRVLRTDQDASTWSEVGKAGYLPGEIAVSRSGAIAVASAEGVDLKESAMVDFKRLSKGLERLEGTYSKNITAIHFRSEELFVALTPAGRALTRSSGLLRYEPASGEWVEAAEGLNASIHSLSISTWQRDLLYAAGADGVFRSSDGGQSWNYMSGTARRVLAIGSGDPETIYASTTAGGVAVSKDSGVTFMRRANGMVADEQIVTVAVYPTSPGRVLAGGRSLYVTSDEGTVWRHAGINDVKRIAISGDTAYAISSTRGVVKSVDRGESWVSINEGLPVPNAETTLDIATDPSNAELVFALLNRLHVSLDGGRTWRSTAYEQTFGGEATRIAAGEGRLFAGAGPNVAYTADAGLTWRVVSSQLPSPVAALAVAGSEVYVALPDDGVFKTLMPGPRRRAVRP